MHVAVRSLLLKLVGLNNVDVALLALILLVMSVKLSVAVKKIRFGLELLVVIVMGYGSHERDV